MKTKNEILKEAYAKIEKNQVSDEWVDVVLFAAMEEYANVAGWVNSSEKGFPLKPNKEKYEQLQCLVIRKGNKDIEMLMWNCEEQCWDEADGDDYCCDADKIEWYKIIVNPVYADK